MRQQTTTACQVLAVLALAILLNPPATMFGDDERTHPEKVIKTIPERSHQAIARGLDFLEKDVVKWRDERQCATCHHGTMTVWTYLEAKNRGYHVSPETIRETVQWTKDRLLERIDLPRDTRPGWSMVNSSAIYLALASTIVPRQDAITADELNRIVDHLVRHQESDGAWKWSSAPPKNRPPPFFESDEVATRLASLALAAKKPKDDAEATVVRDSRQKAADWLKVCEPAETTQAATVRLLMDVREGASKEGVAAAIQAILGSQNSDGGWGQLKDRSSDAYATGQVLYVLALAGVTGDSDEVQRGVTFLVSTQRPDGSWSMVARAHAEATPANFTVPITYFGSVWGTLGLMSCVPPPEEPGP